MIQIRRVTWEDESQALRYIRETVFIKEQCVPVELEWDEFDPVCLHILAVDGDGQLVGTARLLPDGHIGRIAVLKEWRKQGVGSALLQWMIEEMKSSGRQQAMLNAQTDAVKFYEKFGFRVVGDRFMDAGIPHVQMHLAL